MKWNKNWMRRSSCREHKALSFNQAPRINIFTSENGGGAPPFSEGWKNVILYYNTFVYEFRNR